MAAGPAVPETRSSRTSLDAAQQRDEQGIPKFVRLPCGLKTDEDGKLVLDEVTGEPIEEVKLLYVQRTGDALKQIIERSEDERAQALARAEREDEMNTEERAAENKKIATENIDFLYEGLAMILRDPETMQPVDAAWLSTWLDFDVAGEWMEVFVPTQRGMEGPPRSEPASVEEPSTRISTLEHEQPDTAGSSRESSDDSTGTKEQTSQTE